MNTEQNNMDRADLLRCESELEQEIDTRYQKQEAGELQKEALSLLWEELSFVKSLLHGRCERRKP